MGPLFFCLQLLGMAPVALAQDPAPSQDVILVHASDFYEIAPTQDAPYADPARFASLLRRDRAQFGNRLIFTLGGDYFSPSRLSEQTRGASMVEVLNALRPDVTAIGNHDFDFGSDGLRVLMERSTFPYLATNIRDHRTGAPIHGALMAQLFNLGDLRVGFISLLTPSTKEMKVLDSSVDIQDPIEVARTGYASLKSQGADVVVAITHLRNDEDRDLARAVPELDLILGGHDHVTLDETIGTVRILKTGTNMQFYTRIRLRVRGRADARGESRLDGIATDTVPLLSIEDRDPEMLNVVQHWKALQSEKHGSSLSNVLGEAEMDFLGDRETLRTKQSPLGAFLADTFRQAYGAEIALFQSGIARAGVPKGPITSQMLHEVLPWEYGTQVLIQVRGDVIRRALEHALSRLPSADGRYFQTSGLQVIYDSSRPSGQRVVEVRVRRENSDSTGRIAYPLMEAEKIYTVSVDNYTLQKELGEKGGGDGHEFAGFEYVVDPAQGRSSLAILEAAIRGKGRISASAVNRFFDCRGAFASGELPLPVDTW